MIRALTTTTKSTKAAASSIAALLKVRSRSNSTDSIRTLFSTRGLSSYASPYSSIPVDGYWPECYPERISDGYNPISVTYGPYGDGSGFGRGWRNDSFLACGHENDYNGGEFGGRLESWEVGYGVVCGHGADGLRGCVDWSINGCGPVTNYATQWINGGIRRNQHSPNAYGWIVQPQMTVDYGDDVVAGKNCYGWSGYEPFFSGDYAGHWNGNPIFFSDGVGGLIGGEHPVNPNWISGHYSGSMPGSMLHGTYYAPHWNDLSAGYNQVGYEFHGYSQSAKPMGDMDEGSGNPERFDGRYEYSNGPHSQSLSATQPIPTASYVGEPYINQNAGDFQQNLSSVPYGSGAVFQGNGPPGNLNTNREAYQQTRQRQSYTSNYTDRSYSNNENGFQKNLSEHGSDWYGSRKAEGPHHAGSTDFWNGGPEVKEKNTVNLGSRQNWDVDGRRNGKHAPQNFTLKERPATMIDQMGQLRQHQEGDEAVEGWNKQLGRPTADSNEQQQPRANITPYRPKIDRHQRPALLQNSDWDFLGDREPTPSPTLNAPHSDEGSQVSKCENPVEDPVPERIRGTVEELERFTRDGKLTLAVEALDAMEKKQARLDPDRDISTVKMLIRACADSKAVTEAKAVHKHIANLMSPVKFSLYNKILRMYLKCGDIEAACSMFYNMAAHNLTSWDTMIKGLVMNDLGEEALDMFAEFKNTDSDPDGPMFLSVFSACRLIGDVTEGMLHFESMIKRYGIAPSMKHYVSVVDMMGHAGHLEEAMEFVENMPVEASVDVWETLMRFCRVHGNMELGDRCAEMLGKLDATRLSDESKAGLLSSGT